jgi:hypothetical protein
MSLGQVKSSEIDACTQRMTPVDQRMTPVAQKMASMAERMT